jgi:hypothetical protein
MKNNYLYGIGIFLTFLVVSMPFCFASEMSLTYDTNGNLITGDGKYRTYNSLNQLWKVYNGSSPTLLLEEYMYHPTEERVWVKKSYNTSGSLVETVYYINQYRVIIQNATGIYTYTYVYQDGTLVAQLNPDGSKIFFVTDIKGSVVAVTNATGQVLERISYSPTAEILSGGRQSRFNYEGKEQDTGTSSVPLSGLVSYYSLNDGTQDEVLGNNGVAVNATRTSGFIRDAYYFDGSADYLLVNDSSSLDISSNITLSAWVYPVRTTQGYVICKYGSYMIQWTNSTFQGGIWNSTNWYALTTSGTIPLNTWAHVTFTYNRSNAYLYINGVLNSSGVNTRLADINTNPFMIGAKSPIDRTRDFNGSVDEVGVWNRAISSTEAKTLYDYGRNYDENAATDFNFRQYKPPQFTQPDTIISELYNSQNLNRYSFEDNSPYNRIDPTGHIWWILIPIIIEIITTASLYAVGNVAVEYEIQIHDIRENTGASRGEARDIYMNSPDRRQSTKDAAISGGIFGGASGLVSGIVRTAGILKSDSSSKSLYHYTDKSGMNSIIDSNKLNPSLKQNNPLDVRYGNGQYLSDITPGTKTSAQLSRNFINNPFHSSKYTNYVEIDVTDLTVIKGREGVYLVPNEKPLDLTNRIISYGEVK